MYRLILSPLLLITRKNNSLFSHFIWIKSATLVTSLSIWFHGGGGFILERSDENCYCFNPEVIQTLRDSPGRAAPAWLYNFFITSNWIALIITVALFHLSCERAEGHHLWKTSIQPRVWVGRGGERWQLNRLSRGKWFTSHGIKGRLRLQLLDHWDLKDPN